MDFSFYVKLCLSCAFVLIIGSLRAQCPDFTDLSSPQTHCYYGTFNDPTQHSGIVQNRHTVISTQGTDPNTGGQLPLLPEGEEQVIRLGNDSIGAQSEMIEYTFSVNPDNAILLVKFAVILEDPDHPQVDQPRFVMGMYNENGDYADPHHWWCSYYEVSASGSIPDFQTYITPDGNHEIRWRPWTELSFDLTQNIGQEVTVRFTTRDCSWGEHFGYAYFTAHCIPATLTLDTCAGDSVTLIAPPGFDDYVWNNNQTGNEAQYAVADTGTYARCLMTNDWYSYCTLSLNAFISGSVDQAVPTQDTIIYDTTCYDDQYTDNFFDFNANYYYTEYSTRIHFNSFYDSETCSGDVTSILYLTVWHNHFYDFNTVCAGEDFNWRSIHLTDVQVGDYYYTDTVPAFIGCDSIFHLYLTVLSKEEPHIVGEWHPCQGEIHAYTLQNADNFPYYHWHWSESGESMSLDRYQSTIFMCFSDETPVELSLSISSPCFNHDTILIIEPVRTNHIYFADTICAGQEYHENGFDLPMQDSVGYFTFEDHIPIAYACDSVRVLELWVTSTPSVTIQAQDEMICIGEESSMQVIATQNNFNFTELPPPIAIGDILCTDSSFVKPEAYANSGRTAMGIVFYVDNTGEHGWVVALNDYETALQWGLSNNSSLTDHFSACEAEYDVAGWNNTMTLSNEYGNNFASCTAVHHAYYYNHFTNTVGNIHQGWYLPAAGQLNWLFSQLIAVNGSLTVVGGTPFPTDEPIWYWSSTEGNSNYAWLLGFSTVTGDNGHAAQEGSKYDTHNVRCIRNF